MKMSLLSFVCLDKCCPLTLKVQQFWSIIMVCRQKNNVKLLRVSPPCRCISHWNSFCNSRATLRILCVQAKKDTCYCADCLWLMAISCLHFQVLLCQLCVRLLPGYHTVEPCSNGKEHLQYLNFIKRCCIMVVRVKLNTDILVI